MQNIATVNPDGTGVVTLDGQPPAHVRTSSVEEARRALLGLVIDHARRTGQPVEVIARDPDAEHRLSVSPWLCAAHHRGHSPTQSFAGLCADSRARQRHRLMGSYTREADHRDPWHDARPGAGRHNAP